MKTNSIRLILGSLVIGACALAPVAANAQRWGWHPRNRIVVVDPIYVGPRDGWHVRSFVDETERLSNSMRYVFEHDLSHESHRDREHLADAKTAIQRLDESFERLRHYADDARPRAGREEMREVLRRALDVNDFVVRNRQVDDMIGRRWDRLKDDINGLARKYELDELPRR